jgi:hypothetical protein
VICHPPIDACPNCSYALHGLPQAHRCPECAFEYDEATIVFKPSRPWMTYVGTLGFAAILIYFYGPMVYGLTVGALGQTGGAFVSLAILAAPLVILAWRIRRANQIGRFAALTKAGLFVRNIGGLTQVAWDDISLVAIHDIRPWLKRRSSEQVIGLHGILSTREEKTSFMDAVSRGRAGQPPGIRGDALPEDAGATRGQTIGTFRIVNRLTSAGGVILLISGVLFTLAAITTHPRNQASATTASVAAWIGIILLLTGIWRSDQRKN